MTQEHECNKRKRMSHSQLFRLVIIQSLIHSSKTMNGASAALLV